MSCFRTVTVTSAAIVFATVHARAQDAVNQPPPAAPAAQAPADSPTVLRLGEPEPTLHISIAPYIWITSFSGDLAVRGSDFEIDASFVDILEESDSVFGLMGSIDAEYERLVFQFNATWSTAEITGVRSVTAGGTLDGDFDLDNAWFELMGGYRLLDRPLDGDAASTRRFALDAFAGARVTSIDVNATLSGEGEVTLPDGEVIPVGQTRERGNSKTWLEPFIGSRIRLDLSENWAVQVRGDIGGFGIDGAGFAWQVTALVGYTWKLDGWDIALFGGYRALGQDYADGGFEWDMITHGPMIGSQFIFSF